MSKILRAAAAATVLALAVAPLAVAGSAAAEPMKYRVTPSDLSTDQAMAARADHIAFAYCADERRLVQRTRCEAAIREEAMGKLAAARDAQATAMAARSSGASQGGAATSAAGSSGTASFR